MKRSDKALGMNRAISRRDFLDGAALVMGASLLPGCGRNENAAITSIAEQYYPPSLTGMRGNHDGAFDVGHQLGLEGRTDWGPVQEPDAGTYDLVVVGGGISGLSSAYFYRKQNPDARILILDNHDDFGGHAKRTEFQIGNRNLICHGGSETLQSPSDSSDVVKGLLRELGVDIQRFYTAYDREFLNRHGLKAGIHFNKEKWGVDRVILNNFSMWGISDTGTSLTTEQAVAQIPISDSARGEFMRLVTTEEDQIPEVPAAVRRSRLMNGSLQILQFIIRSL